MILPVDDVLVSLELFLNQLLQDLFLLLIEALHNLPLGLAHLKLVLIACHDNVGTSLGTCGLKIF